MTAALLDEAPPRFGSTQARLFTPPLEKHVNPYLNPDTVCDQCHCKHIDGLSCQVTYGYSCIHFLRTFLKWELFPWQEWLYVHALEKRPGGQGFRFPTLVVLVARQNGKTRWLKGLALWRLYLDKLGRPAPNRPAARLALIAMQGLEYAESMLAEANEDIKNARLLRKEWVRHAVANGKHKIILKGRRSWRATTANRKGGRSFSADLACLDELREHHTWDSYSAITPTVIARPFGQVVCTSNAGESHSIVLRSLRTGAMRLITTGTTAKTKIGFFEWSVPDDVDPRNAKYWYLANPAMGYGHQQLEDLEGQFEAMQFDAMAKFQTEHLCQWVDALDPGIIPAEAWHNTMDANSARANKQTPVYACVDINYNRNKAYIAIATRRRDGKLHFEIVAAARGTEWVLPWLKQRKDKFVAIAVQKVGAPASNLVKPMQDAGLPVREWFGSELQQGYATFYDALVQGTAMHRPAGSLDRAAAATIAKPIGDSAFVFDRRNSPVDAAPLCAAAGAVWAESMGALETVGGGVHEWPDEDTMARWARGED